MLDKEGLQNNKRFARVFFGVSLRKPRNLRWPI